MVTGEARRKKIVEILQNAEEAVSGTELAKLLDVSRQVIVQDIALLRAVNRDILSTTKGYLLYSKEEKAVHRCFLVKHTDEQIEDELCTIVDFGGKVLDVIIMHEIYGEISTDLILKNRQEVYEFVQSLKGKKTLPLKELTGGIHLHTVEAESETTLDIIEAKLKEKGFLVES